MADMINTSNACGKPHMMKSKNQNAPHISITSKHFTKNLVSDYLYLIF